jgi:hypothetical protein
MAASNMIVTLAMNASKYAAGLRKAAGDTNAFGKFTTKAFNLAKGAMLGLTLAVLRYIPTLLNMGAESRKADIQLNFMLETMDGISAETAKTTKRMAAYADQVNRATGIDDEQIKTIQRKLLIFDSLRSTADEVAGSFDRATMAAIDLAAGGFGDMEANAIKLGRMLENPIKNLNAMNRAGIMFTDQEKKKIVKLQESGKLFAAQEIILGKVESRVKGLAEESATPMEKLAAAFENIAEKIGEEMLPYLEQLTTEVNKWLGSAKGKQDVQQIANAFVAGAKGVRDMAKFLKDVEKYVKIIKPIADLILKVQGWYLSNQFGPLITLYNNSRTSRPSPGSSGGGGVGRMAPAGITVNFNAPVDSVSAGREVARVLSDYNRANGVR